MRTRVQWFPAIFLVATAALARADAPRPEYGAWGFDSAGQDKATRPGDDFFRFANGAWIDRTAIPADKPGISLRLAMTDRTEQRLRDIFEQAAARPVAAQPDIEAKAGAFWRSFMDEQRIEKLGAAAIEPELAAVRAAATREALAAGMGRSNVAFDGTLFAYAIDVDLKDPEHYVVYIGQSGLGLPDRDYYLADAFAAQKKQYQAYVATLLRLVAWPEPEARATDVVAFETRLAEASWSKTAQRDPVATYNPMTIAELEQLAPGFAWKDLLAQAGLDGAARVIVAEKSAFPRLAAIHAATPLATLQAWAAFHVADNAAPYLSRAFADAHFDLHDRALTGQQQQAARWKRGVLAVGGGDFGVGARFGTFGTLGWATGELYTAHWFPPSAKARIEALVANLKAAYRVRLEALDWMGPETKREALRKLDTYTIKVGYPDHARDHAALVVDAADLAGNVRRAAQAEWAFRTGRLDGPVDRSEWQMTPQTNDAYNGALRDIVFPAGILQAPMFDVNADPAINYGAIGGVIGHELTHGFDDQGRKIDAEGRLRDWWTKEDAAQFDARARTLGAQYSRFEPVPGAHVNGDLTMGENIADLGGLALALDAYKLSLGGKPAPVIDGLSGEQRVMLGWAQAWRGKFSEDFVRKQVVSDPHSPRQYRVNGVVRNLDAWYAAFGVQPGDKLFIAPAERARIW